MSEEKQPLGFLFESIAYYNPSDIDKFIDSLSFEQSHYIITKSLEMAFNKNIFSLQESEILSKSLRLLNTKYLSNNDSTGQE
jgi:hypothetical protein